MDIIFSMGIGFSLLLCGTAAVLFVASYVLYQKVVSARKAGRAYNDIFRERSVFIIILFMLWFLFLNYLRVQTALRPKNTLASQNADSQETKQASTSSISLSLPPAQGDINDQQNQGYSEKNAQENQKAIDAFSSQD